MVFWNGCCLGLVVNAQKQYEILALKTAPNVALYCKTEHTIKKLSLCKQIGCHHMTSIILKRKKKHMHLPSV